MAPRVLGVDLDNTVIDYDALLARIAREEGWLSAPGSAPKRELRDTIRRLPDGEAKWTRLQALAYGTRIEEARLAPGFTELLAGCRAAGVSVHVVSHKTRAAAADPTVDLRDAALVWMDRRGLFEDAGITRLNVHFEDTRAAKIATIAALGCDAYVDDLEETFAEPAFPPTVKRILIGADAASVPGVVALRDWRAVTEHLFGVASAAEALIGTRVERCARIPGGRNNRLYEIRTATARYVVKEYFRHGADDRDRLASEFDGLRALRAAGARQVPEAIAADRARGIAVYEHVDGDPVRDLGPAEISSAVAFVRALRAASQHPAASAVGLAAEACFSLEEVIASVAARLQSLRAAAAEAPELGPFLDRELAPVFARVVEGARAAARAWDLGPSAFTPPEHRVLSPSDFGFHNALRRRDGALVFLDLEYFGWDDAVKMISDFVLQPVVALPRELAGSFVDGASEVFPRAALLRRRVAAIQPLFALKWALIFLNEFLPERQRRRLFVDASFDVAAARSAQLAKARAMVRRVLS